MLYAVMPSFEKVRTVDARSQAMIDDNLKGPGRADPDVDVEEARLRQQAIGVKLRQMFDQVVNEPVPEEFFDILRRGDHAKSQGGRS